MLYQTIKNFLNQGHIPENVTKVYTLMLVIILQDMSDRVEGVKYHYFD